MSLAVVAVISGCSGSGDGSASTTAAAPAPTTTAPTSAALTAAPPTGSTFPSMPAAKGREYYVSLGDSYAAGYQATTRGKGMTTTNGFAYQVVNQARTKGYDYTLVNFGCGGATTQSMLTSSGCRTNQLGPGTTPYRTPQTTAAVAFLEAHRGHVGLITVSIGGNDVIPCGIRSDALSCLTASMAKARSNLNTILSRVRAAAGPSTRIVGTTYPDVFLGNLLSTDTNLRSLATLSVTAFQSLINPQLKQAYESAGGRFVDVTAAFGSYLPLTQKTTLAPLGSIPVPVAKICTLTFYCELQDIHPRTAGYTIIADLVTGTLPRA